MNEQCLSVCLSSPQSGENTLLFESVDDFDGGNNDSFCGFNQNSQNITEKRK